MRQVVSYGAMPFEEFDRRFTGKRYEYVDGSPLPRGPETTDEQGEPTVEPRPPELRMLATQISYHVARHILAHKLGVPLLSGIGFFMQQTPPELREADFAFLTPARAEQAKLGAWLPSPPDFAVEIIGEWETDAYVKRKSAGYMANGTRLVWWVNPKTERVTVCQPGKPPTERTFDDRLDGGDVLPGLALSIRDCMGPI